MWDQGKNMHPSRLPTHPVANCAELVAGWVVQPHVLKVLLHVVVEFLGACRGGVRRARVMKVGRGTPPSTSTPSSNHHRTGLVPLWVPL